MKNYLQRNLQSFFFVGMDPDGYRIYRIDLGINIRTPVRQRYDKYVGLLGQVHDIQMRLRDLWGQYLVAIEPEQKQENDGTEETPGQPA